MINPPGPTVETLLILPVQSTNTSKIKPFGFYYVYDIVNRENPAFKASVEFKLPIKDGFIVVDSLPPGKYRLQQHSLHPIGRGTRTYDDNVFLRNDQFTLRANEVTIFRKSLNVNKVDDPKGKADVNSITYRSIDPVTATQKKNILSKLAEFPAYAQWRHSEDNAQTSLPVPPSEEEIKTLANLAKQYAPAKDISGRYESEITSSSFYAFKKPYRNIQVQFEQKGNQIEGTDDSGELKIRGEVHGNTVKYYVIPGLINGYYEVSGEWLISDDGNRLEGIWNDGRGDQPGIWNLQKIGP